ncbi:fatty acid desaturase family protein [Aliikangiella coralliicola]|uniref:Fatty acid desaturase domain-containing protein n=1 Tax=Aliikangiella coralliicola TaxID=2592383 RepID=A0A545TV43_9GAMM|nr:fatty acid desaturase family protein [Aliikangiella coralliicola]TQV81095.1 hypothetical protein FLL46_26150 [Aliikangiella coralliicola]
MVNEQEIQRLKKIRPNYAILSLALDWLQIFAAFYVAIMVDHWLFYLIAMVFIARCQHALYMMMHEAAHFGLHSSILVNNYIGQFAIAGPALFSLFVYRSNHLNHHRHPTSDDDQYPLKKSKFAVELLEDLFCYSYFRYMKLFIVAFAKKVRRRKERDEEAKKEEEEKRIADKLKAEKEDLELEKIEIKNSGGNVKGRRTHPHKLPKYMVLSSMLLGNGIIILFFYLLDATLMYPILWLLPMFSILFVFFRIRGVCEHGGLKVDDNSMLTTRTIINPLQAYFFHPHRANYHIEHHLYPNVPYYNLKKLHTVIKEGGQYNTTNVYRSYFHIINNVVTY